LTRDLTANYTYSGSGVLPGDEEAAVTVDTIIWNSDTFTLTGMGTGVVRIQILQIPTVSEWGMIVLGLMMLTVGLLFIRKQQTELAQDIGS
jgi:hypothetical protein